MPSRNEEPFACPIGVALWEEYRRRRPNGLTVLPVDGKDVKDRFLLLISNTSIPAMIATNFRYYAG
jgi:hypothetical protein